MGACPIAGVEDRGADKVLSCLTVLVGCVSRRFARWAVAWVFDALRRVDGTGAVIFFVCVGEKRKIFFWEGPEIAA